MVPSAKSLPQESIDGSAEYAGTMIQRAHHILNDYDCKITVLRRLIHLAKQNYRDVVSSEVESDRASSNSRLSSNPSKKVQRYKDPAVFSTNLELDTPRTVSSYRQSTSPYTQSFDSRTFRSTISSDIHPDKLSPRSSGTFADSGNFSTPAAVMEEDIRSKEHRTRSLQTTITRALDYLQASIRDDNDDDEIIEDVSCSRHDAEQSAEPITPDVDTASYLSSIPIEASSEISTTLITEGDEDPSGVLHDVMSTICDELCWKADDAHLGRNVSTDLSDVHRSSLSSSTRHFEDRRGRRIPTESLHSSSSLRSAVSGSCSSKKRAPSISDGHVQDGSSVPESTRLCAYETDSEHPLERALAVLHSIASAHWDQDVEEDSDIQDTPHEQPSPSTGNEWAENSMHHTSKETALSGTVLPVHSLRNSAMRSSVSEDRFSVTSSHPDSVHICRDTRAAPVRQPSYTAKKRERLQSRQKGTASHVCSNSSDASSIEAFQPQFSDTLPSFLRPEAQYDTLHLISCSQRPSPLCEFPSSGDLNDPTFPRYQWIQHHLKNIDWMVGGARNAAGQDETLFSRGSVHLREKDFEVLG